MTTQQKFISDFSSIIINGVLGTTYFPSVTMAQLIIETNWGKSINKAYNNLFGIKANSGYNGKVVSLTTHEYINGVKTKFPGTGTIYKNRVDAIQSGAHVQTLFRVYANPIESVKDRVKFLIENPRYSKNGVLTAKTPEEQAEALQRSGYATSPIYAKTLIDIINQYDLKKLDEKKN